ncbi:hypothetical protein [Streptomyces sp. NPDC057939]|uniref:hypothetical protein n=1 Tax=Streptomyces sp. NPDC057939 TaxID=3346284 RepID=UPI0036EE356E
MSTPEEQQRGQQQAAGEQDPWTQTWQGETWDTSYQPVQPPLGSVPGQPVAPEGWFREEAAPQQGAQQPQTGQQQGQQGQQGYQQSQQGQPGYQQHQQSQQDWGVPQPAPTPWPSEPVAEQTAYLPPYPGPAAPQAQQQQQQQQQPVAPEGWFREEAAPQQQPQQPQQPHQHQEHQPQSQEWGAPQADRWSADPRTSGGTGFGAGPGVGTGAGPGAAAEQTAYLPPYPGPGAAQEPPQQPQPVAPDGWFREEAPQPPQQPRHAQPRHAQPQPWEAESAAYSPPAPDAAAEQTAYLPPVREGAAEQTAYLPPVREGAAEQTAYLPPVREGAAEQTAYLPPVREGAAEQTAYLSPVREGAAEQTAYLPPYPGPGAPAAGGPASVPAAGGPAAEYSPPTLGGNTIRAVDPAQARAEGRSPIIDPGPQSAILTAALGLLLAVAAAFGDFALLLPLVALQALTAAGWFRLNGMWPARQGIALAFLGALVADAAVLAVDDTYGPGAIIGTLGAWVLLTLVLQLRSHADPDERMYGLMASVASAALAIACAGFLAADGKAVSVGAAAVAVAVFTRALPLPTLPSVAVSLGAAAGAGIAVGTVTGTGTGGALIGLAAGICALIGLRVAAYDYPSKFVHMTAGVALPLAVAAPAVYLIGRVVG